MAKRCGFCSFSTEDDAAFPEHMRIAHGWGAQLAAAVSAAPMAAPLAPGATDGVARFCGNCGVVRDSLSTRFCRNCGASYETSVAAQPASLAFAPKAGFWIRLGAYIIDIIAVSAFGFVVGIGLGLIGVAARVPRDQLSAIGNVLGALISLAYFLYFWSRYGHGQTLGMRVRKLRVVRTDGSDLSIPRAFLRWIGFNLGLFVLFIGPIWAGFDPNKQGWHDKLADTYVVMVR